MPHAARIEFQRSSSIRWFGHVVALLMLVAGSERLPARELLTFDSPASSGQVSLLARTKLQFWQPSTSAEEGGSRPQGRALRLSGPAGAGFVAKLGDAELDWRKLDSLSCWLHRTADEAKEHPTVAFEIRLLEEDRKAHFRRKVEASHVGWQKIVLPLDWFFWSDGRIPQWERVRSIVFVLRDAGSLTIDTLESADIGSPRADFPPATVVAPVAFPKDVRGKPPTGIRSLETRDVELLTNAPSLDLEQLAGHLAKVGKEVQRQMPFLAPPDRGPLLIVFQTRDDYQRFVPRYARHFNGEATVPEAAGLTIQAVSTSSWDEQLGTLRPVYTHEFLHGYISRTARIPSHGDWLQEGLAARFQLQFHPQADFAQLVTKGLALPQLHSPLNELCNGQKIANNRYWQAATLCQMFLTDDRYRARLPALFERLRDATTTDLAPHLDPVWQTDWDGLTKDWRAFCRRTFADNAN